MCIHFQSPLVLYKYTTCLVRKFLCFPTLISTSWPHQEKIMVTVCFSSLIPYASKCNRYIFVCIVALVTKKVGLRNLRILNQMKDDICNLLKMAFLNTFKYIQRITVYFAVSNRFIEKGVPLSKADENLLKRVKKT